MRATLSVAPPAIRARPYRERHQLRFVVERFTARLIEENPKLRDHLGLVKFTLRNKLREFIETETDRLAELAFDRLFQSGRLCFYLECVDCRFQIPSSVELRSTRRLVHNDNSPVQRSLFEWHAESQFNEYERKVALYLFNASHRPGVGTDAAVSQSR